MKYNVERWLENDIEKLRKYFEMGYSIKKIAKLLNRKVHTIYDKLKFLNLKLNNNRWTTKEQLKMELLIKKGIKPKIISLKMNKSIKSIYDKMYQIRHQKVWDNDSINYLLRLYKENNNITYISKKLDRSTRDVSSKLIELGIKEKLKSKWENYDRIFLIKKLDEGISIEEIAKIMNRGKFAVIDECKKLGIRKKYKQIRNFLYNCYPKDKKIEKVLLNRLKSIKERSKKHQLQFNLTIIDLLDIWEKQKGLCFYTDIPMTLKRSDDMTVSVDRIDSNKWYSKDNVVLCCNVINTMKMDIKFDRFINFCSLISRKYDK